MRWPAFRLLKRLASITNEIGERGVTQASRCIQKPNPTLARYRITHAHEQPGETHAFQDNWRGNLLSHAAVCCAGSERPTFVSPTTGSSFAAKIRGTREDARGL